MNMYENVVYDKFDELNRNCLLALRDLILAHDERFVELVKYGMPCFCINKKAVCYLWVDKEIKKPYILLVNGQKISSNQLEKGTRKRMAIYRINPSRNFDMKEIRNLLDHAIQLSIGK